MIREAMSRFGHENLGFFWLMGEPLLLTVGVMVMWTAVGNTHGGAVDVIPFALSSYSLLTLWRHIVGRSVHAMRQNSSLIFHAHIRFLDILIARALLETIGVFAAFLIAYAPLALLGRVPVIHDPLALCGGWLLGAWFAFGFGLVLAGLTELSEAADRFVAPVMYITLPLTGAFYMVEWLPTTMHDIVLWSPLVHAFEMFRSGLFPPEYGMKWSAPYIAVCAFVLTAIGMPLVHYAQTHVEYS
ncbi:sugar ABC transporter permease [Rhodoblastus acidophilus]|uniref:Sugar ABC transporter permease n=2 Tax=Rhodoblastus acidophilus TaxID=1074 RepID=A0A6N8DJ58_RHOAC|nr:sugar ABC transporter permease [Rhodoblastus acidophilus]